MKLSLKEVVAKNFVLELDEKEAEFLCCLLGGIVLLTGAKKPVVDKVYELFNALDAQLPDRELSFEDFFTGSVRVK